MYLAWLPNWRLFRFSLVVLMNSFAYACVTDIGWMSQAVATRTGAEQEGTIQRLRVRYFYETTSDLLR
jgi:hypothetical protein